MTIHFFGSTVDHATARIFAGDSYSTIGTNYSVRVKPDLPGRQGIVWSDSPMGPRLISFIGQFRNHVLGRVNEGLVTFCRRQPDYFADGRALRNRQRPFDPVTGCEVDLTAAYLSAARDLGAVDPKLARLILRKFSKESRLKIVGSLGTIHTVRHYTAGWEDRPPEHRPYNETLRRVWDSIVAHTDRFMATLKTAAGRDFLFYWVDAIFVKPEARDRVRDLVKAAGWDCKSPRKHYQIQRDPANPWKLRVSDGREFSTPALKAAEIMRRVGLVR